MKIYPYMDQSTGLNERKTLQYILYLEPSLWSTVFLALGYYDQRNRIQTYSELFGNDACSSSPNRRHWLQYIKGTVLYGNID